MCSMARTTLRIPARPAAPSVCPMMVLTEPTSNFSCRESFDFVGVPSPSLKKASAMARASRGSPAGVPVPWEESVNVKFQISIHGSK